MEEHLLQMIFGKLGIKDNELLHTEANETYKNYEEHFSKNEMGIIKIRGMIYPYVLMYKNRNDNQQIEAVKQQIERDSQMIIRIYGEKFLERLQDDSFLQEVRQTVKPYDSIIEFAEGMSRELLGIEQIMSNTNKEDVAHTIFGEQEIGKATINTPTPEKENAMLRMQRDMNKELLNNSKKQEYIE